ncbi:DUF2267 domain-containing protein [Arthrobacter sp. D1-29]
MKADEIISAVRSSAGIDSYGHAEKAVKATLTVLGQRLSTEAKDLAAQLPPELGERLTQQPDVERFGLEEFYRRVAEEEGEGCTPQVARRHARAVTAGLREAVGAEYLHVLDQLPDDWADLLHSDQGQY